MLIKKAQNTAEYAILIALVVGAAIGMQTYVKRGLQGRVKDSSRGLVETISGSTDWATLESDGPVVDAVDVEYQYEYDKIKSKSTQETIKDEETYSLAKDGTTVRETTQQTKQAVDDFQEIGY